MILVFGSINMDINVPVPALPRRGETVLGESYHMSAGGKGANQALAAARLGVRVAMAGKIGDDGLGLRAMNSLRRAGVMTSGVAESEKPTGCAVITSDAQGENHIVVATGANAEIEDDQLPDEILKPGNWLMTQTEIPVNMVEAIIRRAHAGGAKVMLNWAPVRPLAADALAAVDILVLNEHEAEQALELLGLPHDGPVADQAKTLAQKSGGTCIITCGAAGSVARTKDGKTITVPALPIDDVVDTAGAGDAYCGILIACLHDGKDINTAMRMAAVAGSLACLETGTQDSFPYQSDIEEKLAELAPSTIA